MKYVAMSDMHLGQNGADGSGSFSVLSDLSASMLEKDFAERKLAALAARIAEFADGDRVSMVLCGDILDLSLSHMRQALSDLVRVIRAVPAVDSIVYVVGNHDHHIWSMHSEEQRYVKPMRRLHLPAPGTVYKMTHPQGERNDLLGNMLSAQAGRKKALDVRVAYPYFMTLVGEDTTVHFSHGHLMGGLYTLTSRILRPRLAGAPPERAAATVNVAVIELIYWLFGEMGERMGANGMIEALHADLAKGKDSICKELIHGLVDTVLENGAVSWIPDSWERACAKWIGGKMAKDLAKDRMVKPISSEDRHSGLQSTRSKFSDWLIETGRTEPTHGRSVFVFGHTHAADHFNVKIVPIDGGPSPVIEAYNMGSWLVEPERPDPDSFILMIDGETAEFAWEKI